MGLPSEDRLLDVKKELGIRVDIRSLKGEDLEKYRINEYCSFGDDKWMFPNYVPGGRKFNVLHWSLELLDGSRFTDERHLQRLHWSKLYVLTTLLLPSSGTQRSSSSMHYYQTSFKYLISWMDHRNYVYPSELTCLSISDYLDYLKELFSERDGEISEEAVAKALSLVSGLWAQRIPLKSVGVSVMSEDPFSGATTYAVARQIATTVRGWIKPIPDEVAIPLFNKASWFLGSPAEDLIDLLEIVRDPLAGVKLRTQGTRGEKKYFTYYTAGIGKESRYRRAKKLLSVFTFRTQAGESGPWRPELKMTSPKGRPSALLVSVREIWEAVRNACLILIQGITGMRVSELLGIPEGIDPHSGLPKGVSVEITLDGLYEWFIIRTVLTKSEDGLPREVDWVLGMRPAGSVEMPLAVKALITLNSIYAPWRGNAKTDRLVLTSVPGEVLPAPGASLDGITSQKVAQGYKNFISRWVDLSNLPDKSNYSGFDQELPLWKTSKGRVLSTHMLRKSWAQYVLCCDARLLPAIQMQFHHINLAMTESGYIGRNPLLVEALDSVATQKRNILIYETVVGERKLIGRMGDTLNEALQDFRNEALGFQSSEIWKRTILWSDRNELKMYFSPHATCCPVSSTEMRCNEGVGAPVWELRRPNEAVREPSMCAGCACAVMDGSNRAFWLERYTSFARMLAGFDKSRLDNGAFREIIFRAEQAKKVLRRLGVDIKSIDDAICDGNFIL